MIRRLLAFAFVLALVAHPRVVVAQEPEDQTLLNWTQMRDIVNEASGDRALRLAKRVRRSVLRANGEQRLLEEANHHFGMPKSALTYAAKLDAPLYVPPPVRPASS